MMAVHHKHNSIIPDDYLIKSVGSDDDMDTLKRDLFNTQEINVGLQLENAELQRCVQDLEARLHDVYQETSLQVDDLTHKLDDTAGKINELETSFDLNLEQRDRSESQLKHTERQLLGLRSSLGQTEAENIELENKLGEAQNQIHKVESELNNAAKTKNHLTKQLEDTEEKVQMLREEVSLLQKVGLERQKNLKWCEKEVRYKQDVASELISNSTELRTKNDDLNKAVNKLQNEVEEFQKAHIMLQEEFFQTQYVLDEVQSEYKMVADEREALSEELQLFYQKHQEVRSDYQLCMHEKHEKEQEIVLLKQHLQQIERDMYEMANTNCSSDDSTCQETEADQDAMRGQADDEGIVLNHDGMHSAKDIDIERPLPELSSPRDPQEEFATATATSLDGHKFPELDVNRPRRNSTLTLKVVQLSKTTMECPERKELEEMQESFQRGWTEATKLNSFREEQVKDLLSKVARFEIQIASLKDQNNQLQQRMEDSSTERVHNVVEAETATTTEKKAEQPVRKLSSDMTKAELIQIIQKLDSELEETKEDLLTARVFNDNFVEYKVKLCRQFKKEESKLFSQEKELCRFRVEQLRLKTEITLCETRLESMTARLNSALSERDRYKRELEGGRKNIGYIKGITF